MDSTKLLAFPIIGILLTAVMQIGNAQLTAPAPAPVSDGVAVDQGIAYILMVAALLITYFVH
uniref:Uncharacterized protein n=1 Tax=Kalanchoe fedtschenkoi TaxID=63787 RepID=A0A7N0TEK5_KALFE